MKASSKSKINKFNNELGYKNIRLSADIDKLDIGKDTYKWRDIYSIEANVVFHDEIIIVIDEEENYNVFKGYLGYELLDSPIGLLNGIEVETTYEKIQSYRVELVINLRNKTKQYILGIYLSGDEQLDECFDIAKEFSEESKVFLSEHRKVYDYTVNKYKPSILSKLFSCTVSIFKGLFYVSFILIKYMLIGCFWFYELIIAVIFNCAKKY